MEKVRLGADTPLLALDFKGSPERSRSIVNEWVSQRTRQRIPALLSPGDITTQTRLVLATALDFHANWQEPFDEAATLKGTFHSPQQTLNAVPTMHAVRKLPFAEMDGVKLLDIPYSDARFSMTLALPDKRMGLPDLERQLTQTRFDKWFESLATAYLDVYIPKFKIEPKSAILISEELRALGINTAFDSGRADYSGMARPSPSGERLFLDAVFHQACVKVDEAGTEASAATEILLRAGTPKGRVPEFRADHPFLFFIRDRQSGAILFMGRVTEPSKA